MSLRPFLGRNLIEERPSNVDALIGKSVSSLN